MNFKDNETSEGDLAVSVNITDCLNKYYKCK